MIRCGSCKQSHETVAEVRECGFTFNAQAQTHKIRCGSCHSSHGSVVEVRACFSQASGHPTVLSAMHVGTEARPVELNQDGSRVVQATPAEREAWTDTRIAGANSLRELRDAFAGPAGAAAASAGQPMPQVPDGFYAVGIGGALKFYKVRHGRVGSSWAGYTFVEVQAGDELHPIRSRQNRFEILSAIAADPRSALARYGRELGVCGHCGRTLTDEQSRALGIGPVCRERV